MKLMRLIFTLSLVFPSASFAAFNLKDVKSITCSDIGSVPEAKIYFTTDNPAANKYVRTEQTIPYDYGNLRGNNAQSGQMEVANEPDLENGMIALVDDYDHSNQSSLILDSTAQPGEYTGHLTGQMEINGQWKKFRNAKISCQVVTNKVAARSTLLLMANTEGAGMCYTEPLCQGNPIGTMPYGTCKSAGGVAASLKNLDGSGCY